MTSTKCRPTASRGHFYIAVDLVATRNDDSHRPVRKSRQHASVQSRHARGLQLSDWFMVILTAVYVAATLYYAILTRRMVHAAREQLEAAKRTHASSLLPVTVASLVNTDFDRRETPQLVFVIRKTTAGAAIATPVPSADGTWTPVAGQVLTDDTPERRFDWSPGDPSSTCLVHLAIRVSSPGGQVEDVHNWTGEVSSEGVVAATPPDPHQKLLKVARTFPRDA